MTGNKKSDREALERLTQAIVDDILEASDEEVMADLLSEGRNPSQEAQGILALIQEAEREVGKARLTMAKAAIAAEYTGKPKTENPLELDEVKRRLADKIARGGLSLAARKGSAPSERDLRSLL